MGLVSKLRTIFRKPTAGGPVRPSSLMTQVESILDAHKLLPPPEAAPEPEPEPEIVPPPEFPRCPACGCHDMRTTGKIRRMGRIERRDCVCQNRNCRRAFRLTIRHERK